MNRFLMTLITTLATASTALATAPSSLKTDLVHQADTTAARRTAVPHGATLADRLAEAYAPSAVLAAPLYANPAMQRYHYAHSLNTLRAGIDYGHASQPVRLEQGSGHSMGYGAIDAYIHKGRATLWGAASYRNGTARHIQYSETSDYDLLYPYLMADTVGGNSHREHYHFMGGFSYPVGRWNIAAEGQYTALMEYRTRDPRPKNLTGDLSGKLGISYATGLHVIGGALTARRYKQTNELKLYNEVSVPTIYHLTGLGSDYYRFRGVNTSTYYKGHAVGGMLSYLNRGTRAEGTEVAPTPAAFAHVGYEMTEISKIISSLNELPMATLRRHVQTAAAGWSTQIGGHTVGISASEEWQRRQGFEHIFGTAQDNIYPQIATAEQYRLTSLRVGALGLWQRALHTSGCRGYYALQPSVYYHHYNEQTAEPARQLLASGWTSALTARFLSGWGRVLTHLQLTGAYTAASTASLTGVNGAMAEPVRHFYGVLAHDAWHTGAEAEVAYRADSRWFPFVRAHWQYAHYAQGQHGQVLTVSAGIHF